MIEPSRIAVEKYFFGLFQCSEIHRVSLVSCDGLFTFNFLFDQKRKLCLKFLGIFFGGGIRKIEFSTPVPPLDTFFS